MSTLLTYFLVYSLTRESPPRERTGGLRVRNLCSVGVFLGPWGRGGERGAGVGHGVKVRLATRRLRRRVLKTQVRGLVVEPVGDGHREVHDVRVGRLLSVTVQHLRRGGDGLQTVLDPSRCSHGPGTTVLLGPFYSIVETQRGRRRTPEPTPTVT